MSTSVICYYIGARANIHFTPAGNDIMCKTCSMILYSRGNVEIYLYVLFLNELSNSQFSDKKIQIDYLI